MSNKINISIVMPVYNCEKYLRESIEGILNQTYKNFELICVDDGSTDDSLSMLKFMAGGDSRIRIITLPHSNAGNARNEGMKYATGKYIGFLDSDDIYESDMLSDMLNKAEDTDADIVVCGSKGIDDTDGRDLWMGGSLQTGLLPNKEVFSASDIKDCLFQFNAGWPWDKLYKRKFISDNEIRFQSQRVANDGFFVYSAFIKASRISHVDKALVTHRLRRKGSIENTKSIHWQCGINMLQSIKEYMKNSGTYVLFETSFINYAAYYTVWYACTIDSIDQYENYYANMRERQLDGSDMKGNISIIDDAFLRDVIISMGDMDSKAFCLKAMNLLWDEKQKRDENIGILNEIISNQDKYIKKTIGKKHWYFPEEQYPQDTRFVIYGYGKVGRDFARQLNNSKHSELVAVIDEKWEELKGEEFPIVGIDSIGKLTYDYIIVSVRNIEVARQIMSDIQKLGVEGERIICPVMEEI